MDLESFVKFPLQDNDWVKKIIIGCVITIIPILNLLTLGYLINCLQSGLQGRMELPEWQDWGNLFKDGILALLIIIFYLLVPAVLFPLLSFIPVIGAIIASILLLLAGLMVPMALARFTLRRNFADAFQVDVILAQALSIIQIYLPIYLAMILVYALSFIITAFVPLVSFIGVLLLFYASILFFNLTGRLYNGSRFN